MVNRPAVATAPPAAVATAVDVLGPLAVPGAPLGPRTTYRVGGAAAVLVEAASVADLVRVAAAVEASALPVLAVGRGSNLLVADAGFAGIAVVVGAGLDRLDVAPTTVTAGGGLALPALARRSAAAGRSGLEWAVGVPGSVGGGVAMNAGGHGSDMAACVVRATVVDLGAGGRARDLDTAALGFGYRRSALAGASVVTSATFACRTGDPAAGAATIRDIVRWRREHQPGGQNAGSVFTNPPMVPPGEDGPRSAGWLIDRTGLRGLRCGSAQVSDKHANFIQADAGGSADDVLTLMATVRDRVAERWQIRLSTEHRFVGFADTNALVEVEG